MKQKVLIVAIFCAFSVSATPTFNLGGLGGGNGLSSGGGAGGINPLKIVHSLLRSFVPGLGGSSSSSGSESSSLDFSNDASFTGEGTSSYDASASGVSSGGTQYASNSGYSYQPPPPPPPPPVTNTYLPPSNGYLPPSTGGISSGGVSSIGTSGSGISSSGSGGSSVSSAGGLGGFNQILGTLTQLPVTILNAKKGIINGLLDRKIAHFQKKTNGAA